MIISYRPNQRADTKFKDWMAEVDKLLLDAYGIDHNDVIDYPWRDLFDDEFTPQEAFTEWEECHED